MSDVREQVVRPRRPGRCPYCHDALGDVDLATARTCERCQAAHHADCWLERCASCGGASRGLLTRARAGVPDRALTAWGLRLNTLALAAWVALQVVPADWQRGLAFLAFALLWILSSAAAAFRFSDRPCGCLSWLHLAAVMPMVGQVIGLLCHGVDWLAARRGGGPKAPDAST